MEKEDEESRKTIFTIQKPQQKNLTTVYNLLISLFNGMCTRLGPLRNEDLRM